MRNNFFARDFVRNDTPDARKAGSDLSLFKQFPASILNGTQDAMTGTWLRHFKYRQKKPGAGEVSSPAPGFFGSG
jgi:hypothetical protein